MQGLTRKLSFASAFLRQRDYDEVRAILHSKLWYTEQALGLRRDLSLPFVAPDALISMTVRPVLAADLRIMLDVNEMGISREERRDRAIRLHLANAGFAHCYVAVTEGNRPCFIQWVMLPSENRILHRAFNGLFPPLAADEVLLEGAYTPAAFRGRHIMPAAMALIAEAAGELGAARVITFVGSENTPSLKGCKRAGFVPYATRRAVHRFGYRQTTFSPLPLGTPFPFDLPGASG